MKVTELKPMSLYRMCLYNASDYAVKCRYLGTSYDNDGNLYFRFVGFDGRIYDVPFDYVEYFVSAYD